MGRVRFVAAHLLGLPLLVFGLNYFLAFFEMPEPEGDMRGLELLQSMRDGGLMAWISASHVIVAVMLFVPRLRFFGGVVQLPLSIGILAFHITMLPEGMGPAIGLVVLNLAVVAHPAAIHAVLRACST